MIGTCHRDGCLFQPFGMRMGPNFTLFGMRMGPNFSLLLYDEALDSWVPQLNGCFKFVMRFEDEFYFLC